MPLVGTRDLSPILAASAIVPVGKEEHWELPGPQILQLMYEIDDSGMTSLLPPALHPTVPPTLVFTVMRVPDSPAGPFVLAQVRVGCRSGARPRGFSAAAYCDSPRATEALRRNWGYPLEVAECSLVKRYDRIDAEVTTAASTVLKLSLMNPEPIGGNDLLYLSTLNVAKVERDGVVSGRLVQVDPDYVFRSADRGKPQLEAFDAAAWQLEGASTNWPVSASYAVADITMPALRYLVDPVKAPLASVERV